MDPCLSGSDVLIRSFMGTSEFESGIIGWSSSQK